MGGAKARNLTIGTALVAALILLGTWFLAVSPQLAAAAETRVDTEDQLARQDILRAQLATLRQQFEDIDTYKAELTGLQAQIPPTAELPDYVREIQAIASAHGVTVTGLSPGVPIAVQEPVVVAPAPVGDVTDDPAAPADAAEGDGDVAASAAPAQPASRLVAVPVSATVMGTYAAVTSFLEAMQTGTARLYLVTSLSANMQSVAEASGGRPATSPGDLEVTVDGVLYVLPPLADVAAGPEEGTDADADGIAEPEPDAEVAPKPLPSSERNPFAPVAGS